MKSDLAVYEIKHLLKRFEKQNRIKTVVLVGAGIAFIVAVIIFIVLKVKKSDMDANCGYDYDDWEDLEEMDYEDYDYDDYDANFNIPEEETEEE